MFPERVPVVTQPERSSFPVAQKLFQNIFPSSINHSQFAGPNRSRLIETGPDSRTPRPSGSGKKGSRAFFKSLEFFSSRPIPHDTKTGNISLARPMCPTPRTSKSPSKTTVRTNPKSATDNHQSDFSLFQNRHLANFQNLSSFPDPKSIPRDTKKPETSFPTFTYSPTHQSPAS